MATRDQLRQMVSAQPFRPFLIQLAGGRSFAVQHPELVACSVNGREMTVYDDDGVHLVEMLLVEVMERTEAAQPARGNGTWCSVHADEGARPKPAILATAIGSSPDKIPGGSVQC